MNALYIVLLMALSLSANARDEFGSLKCDEDIAKAVVGKKVGNENTKKMEAAHKNLALKHLGTDGLADDPYNLVFWQICENEYVFLLNRRQKQDSIADIIKIPAEWKGYPQVLPGSTCQRDGKKEMSDIFAIIDKTVAINGSQKPVKQAWKIDNAKMKFVSLPVTGLSCEKNYDPAAF